MPALPFLPIYLRGFVRIPNVRNTTAGMALGTLLVGCVALEDESLSADITGAVQVNAPPEAVLINVPIPFPSDTPPDKRFAKCTGVLVSPHVALTAAHCLTSLTAWTEAQLAYGQWDVIAMDGRNSLALEARQYDTENDRTMHGVDYTAYAGHDVAALKLLHPISLAWYPTIATRPLSVGTDVLEVGRNGHGELSLTRTYVSDRIPIKTVLPNHYVLPLRHEGGDSGGPVYAADNPLRLVALVSNSRELHGWGARLGLLPKREYELAGGGVARLDVVRGWIQQVIREWDPAFLAAEP